MKAPGGRFGCILAGVLVAVLGGGGYFLWGRLQSAPTAAEASERAEGRSVARLIRPKMTPAFRVGAAVARQEATPEADSQQPEERSRQDISDFVAETVMKLAEADAQGERDLLRELRRLRRPTLLRALRGLARDGESTLRKEALYAVGLCFGTDARRLRTVSARGQNGAVGGEALAEDSEDLGVISDGVPEDEDEEVRAARLSHDLIDATWQGLQDESKDVRLEAYDVSRTLGEEESAVLAVRILQEGDVELKRTLLREVSAAASERDVMTLIEGIGSEDKEIRQLAAQQLKRISGTEFEDESAALAWWEKAGETYFGDQTKNTGEFQEKSEVVHDES